MGDFYLTQRAFHDLLEIENYTQDKWGDKRAEQYMGDLYAAFGKIADEPEIGELRQQRSYPFLMAPAEKHFAIYQTTDKGIIIATVLHGRRHIENIIDRIGPALAVEIEDILRED